MTDTPNTPPNPNDPQPAPTGGWIYSNTVQQPTTPAPIPAPNPTPVSTPVPPAPPRTASVQPATPKPQPKPQDHSLASVIDTIEAIIIALIIALTFRAFIVEAFVIPTGSMAPTLLGAHFKVICPACGYEYDRNASLWHQLKPLSTLEGGGVGISRTPDYGAELTSNRNVPADESAPLYCPNCSFPITPNLLPQFLGYTSIPLYDGRRETRRPIPTAWANNGDRILVMKYLYSILEPSRFDVIVFKEPSTAQFNYIKRLIGLPNETIEIVGGDIYVGPPGKSSPADREIARKPDHLQSHLWQLVYDNDHYPVDEGRPRPPMIEAAGASPSAPWSNPWSPSDAARWKKGPAMDLTGPGPAALQFNFRQPYGLNVLGYNNDSFIANPNLEEPLFPVGDLRLETLWAPADTAGAASITLTLGRSDNLFRVTWAADKVTLQHFDPASKSWTEVTSTPYRPATAGAHYRLALDNVDHAIHFWVDGAKVLSYEPRWTAENAHTEEQTREAQGRTYAIDAQVRVDVAGPCSLSHLKLFRDLYYTPGPGPRTAAARPLTLGPDEFFALGDNSRKSSDGRAWDRVFPALDDLGTRPGIVPRRYLLGKAFFVYWPAGYRVTSNESIPLAKDLPLVPNTGSMRLIR